MSAGCDRDRLVAFFRGDGTDDRGRTLDEILAQDDDWLEHTHDFVQWVFPLDAPSGVNPDAPLVTPDLVRDFAADPALRGRLQAAFERMLAFYGLQEETATGDAPARIVPSPAWAACKGNWFVRPTHNDLRISRILRSVSLLGLAPQSHRLLSALERLRAEERDCGITPTALRYWREAGAPDPAAPRSTRPRDAS